MSATTDNQGKDQRRNSVFFDRVLFHEALWNMAKRSHGALKRLQAIIRRIELFHAQSSPLPRMRNLGKEPGGRTVYNGHDRSGRPRYFVQVRET